MTSPASPKAIRLRLAADDRRDSAEQRAQAGPIYPERIFMAWRTSFKIPVALDQPMDKMPIFICVTHSGNNKAFAAAFSLS